jgi:hypothetical protein
MKRPPHFAFRQRMTIAAAILCIVMVLVILQLWLLTATMEAYLGGDNTIAVPAAIASFFCFLLNFGLLYFYGRGLDD